MKIKERALALFISLVMVLTLMPAIAFANDSWTAEAKNPAPMIQEQGGEVELEVVMHDIGYGGGWTYNWYKLPDSGIGENILLEEDGYTKITVYEPGTYMCVVKDIDEKQHWVYFYVGANYNDPGWTAQIRSITVSFADNEDNSRFQFREGVDMSKIWRWNDALDDEEEIDGYDYWFYPGDKITATLRDGTTKTVVAEEQQMDDGYWIKWFVQEDNDYLPGGYYAPDLVDNQLTTPWRPDGENTFWVSFGGIEDEEGNLTPAESTHYTATIVPTDDLERAKAAALDKLNELMEKYDSCRPAQQQELVDIYFQAEDEIENATTVAEVNAALTSASNAISAVKTDAQLKDEEAAAAAAAAAAVKENERQGTPDGTLPKVKISAPKAGKKSATIKWKKLSKKQLKSGATNIEVWICPNTGFGPNDTIVRTPSKKKASVKVKGLAKGTYFVKVRAIKTVGAVKYVGPWSGTKKVKIKK